MIKILLSVLLICVISPLTARGGCFERRVVVRNHVQRIVRHSKAQFIAVEQPFYLDLVAAQKRQELQANRFEAAVDARVETKLEAIRAELEKLRKGDTTDTRAPSPPGSQPDRAAEAGEVPNDLVLFLQQKCAGCHTGSSAEGTESSFVLFADDGSPQLTAGKLIEADLVTYSNRMPPKEKLTAEEYSRFRAAFQTWEREIRETARKSD